MSDSWHGLTSELPWESQIKRQAAEIIELKERETMSDATQLLNTVLELGTTARTQANLIKILLAELKVDRDTIQQIT